MKQNVVFKPDANYYEQASDRLLFRSLSSFDQGAWLEFFIDESYHHFLGQDLSVPAKTRAKIWIDRQMQRKDENEFGQLAIIEKVTGKLIGLGGIICREMNNTVEYEVTYSLIPRYWGKGYATELARHFRDYAKDNLSIDSVISMIHPENGASIKVAKNNNMTLSGEHIIFDMLVHVYRHMF